MRLKYFKYDVRNGLRKVKTRTGVVISTAALVLASGTGITLTNINAANAVTPQWNVNGSYTLDFVLSGSHYVHDTTISGQDGSGNFIVAGGYPAGSPHSYDWNGTGTISGNVVTMSVDYTTGAPGTHMDVTGTVASDGTLIGTWSDNFGGARNGTFTTATGHANHIASQIVVTPPVNSQDWNTVDTTSGGTVNFVNDTSAPGAPHTGSLRLTTDNTTEAKAQYMHAANTPLSDVIELSYWTKQNSASFTGGDASYQLPTLLNGATGFTTLVYEPYQGGQGAVVNGEWQQWNIETTGLFWSSRTVVCSNGTVTGGAGGPAIYTLTQIKSMCPEAVVIGFGVNIGSNNPSYDVETDLVNFNGTTYNFEPFIVVTDKDACKKNGWMNQKDTSGNSFKNQGDCVSFVATNGKNPASTH
jgi:hypothetical protein